MLEMLVLLAACVILKIPMWGTAISAPINGVTLKNDAMSEFINLQSMKSWTRPYGSLLGNVMQFC